MAVRVLICNRIRLYAEGLHRLLQEERGVEVTGVFNGGRELEDAEDLDADVVIADGPSFPSLAGRVKKILLIRDAGDRHALPPLGDLRELIEKGLAGILDAGVGSTLLRKAVDKVHEGELWLDHQIIRDSFCRPNNSHPEICLSRREAEIMHSICEGLTNKQIAARLFISEQTVKTHCYHLFKKFGVSSRLQLALSTFSEE